MKAFQIFTNSFRELNKKFIHVFLIDAVYWAAMVFLWFLLEKFLGYKSGTFAGGKTTEEMKQLLATAAPEELSAFLSELKVYIVSTIGSVVIFVILAIVLFALVQALIWHLILNKKFRKKLLWKWIWFTLLSILIFLISLVPFLIIKILILVLLRGASYNAANAVSQAINLIYFLIFLFFFFLYCHQFTKEPKAWQSLADTFGLIKKKFKGLATHYVFALILAAVLSLVIYLLLYLISGLQAYSLYISGVISLLFLAWLRIYLVKIVH